ncbi:MAG: helix-turn-helix transcriptional regulator [Deltaproteobacteria bacterium]|nr:helix-turn-helix transcriptional regulator [Deltaproteobacteria bacterium]MBI5893237.1 helix-turn-helix transcriptional regulator [Deltaproteobacteria bacterium]
METLGYRIRKIRELLSLNQSELAIRMGLGGPTVISKYEKNQVEPNISTLTKISELGAGIFKSGKISLDWLLTGEGEMQKQEKLGNEDTELTELIEKIRYIWRYGGFEEEVRLRGTAEKLYNLVLKNRQKEEEEQKEDDY